MVRRIAAATVGILCFVMVGLAAADVTFVLNNGERQSGQLVYRTGTNIGLVQNGVERTFAVGDVAVILYNDGDPSPNELNQLPTSDNPPELERHTLVLRNGQVLHGKVYHWNSDSVIFDTTSGRGTWQWPKPAMRPSASTASISTGAAPLFLSYAQPLER